MLFRSRNSTKSSDCRTTCGFFQYYAASGTSQKKTTMASRTGRPKKKIHTQSNTLRAYLTTSCVDQPSKLNTEKAIVELIINELIGFTVSSRKHDGSNLRSKTLSDWKLQFPWLAVEKICGEMRLNCDICRKAAEPCKLNTVWAFEGI